VRQERKTSKLRAKDAKAAAAAASASQAGAPLGAAPPPGRDFRVLEGRTELLAVLERSVDRATMTPAAAAASVALDRVLAEPRAVCAPLAHQARGLLDASANSRLRTAGCRDLLVSRACSTRLFTSRAACCATQLRRRHVRRACGCTGNQQYEIGAGLTPLQSTSSR
jgi:hypothetical protein